MTTDGSRISDQGPKGASLPVVLLSRVGLLGRRKPSVLFLGVLLALAVSSGVLAVRWAMAGFMHSRQIVTVPDLSGKTLEQALDLLSPFNLGMAKEAVQVDENSPPGAILRHSPPAGLHVREGKIVRVTLSSGGQVVFVPDLVSVSLTEAQNRLRSAGLALGAVTQVYSVQNEAGQVLDQTPPPSSVIRPNSMVDLRVSKGPPPDGMTLMPDFINRPFSSARQWADEQKISPEIKEEWTAVFPPGAVIRQSPAPDSAVNGKTMVSFVVAISSGTAAGGTVTVRYQLPVGSAAAQVRVVVRDDEGEREVFSSAQAPGSTVEVPVTPRGTAKVRFFVNGTLVEERSLQ